ncbi:MAG: hypothetical protein KDB50_03300 [Mycobacterium sp.]|nr:hypothetical protein [Mycobacterium sp.]
MPINNTCWVALAETSGCPETTAVDAAGFTLRPRPATTDVGPPTTLAGSAGTVGSGSSGTGALTGRAGTAAAARRDSRALSAAAVVCAEAADGPDPPTEPAPAWDAAAGCTARTGASPPDARLRERGDELPASAGPPLLDFAVLDGDVLVVEESAPAEAAAANEPMLTTPATATPRQICWVRIV